MTMIRKITKSMLLLSIFIVVAGCSDRVIPNIGYVNQVGAVVVLRAEHTSLARMKVNWDIGKQKATAECKRIGYRTASPSSSGVNTQCDTHAIGRCRKYSIEQEYICQK